MSTHTPGPWVTKHRKGDGAYCHTEVYSDLHGGIATCDWTPENLGNGVTGTYREANARLIAAAPDLLAALQDAELQLEYMDLRSPSGTTPTILTRIRTAIARAKGEDA